VGALTFTVPGVPVAWARARQRGRHHFTAPEVTAAKRRVALAARRAGVEKVVDGPVLVELRFDYDAEETTVAVRPLEVGKVTRPDIDNLAKLVLDALNGVAWEDDNQVAMLYAIKVGKGKRA
jgi:Holliday junction resolvase RusA-like endonuclease